VFYCIIIISLSLLYFVIIGVPYIVTIWNVVFANTSQKLGWIWMELGRWSWGLARFQQNHTMGFRDSTKNGSQGRCFLSRVRCTTSATFLGSISAKLSTNTCPGGLSRHMVSHSRKVSVSIPWWTSHRCALPRWLLLRDVPFSSYPPPNVFLCHGISIGKMWMAIFFSSILASERHHRIADLQRYILTTARFLVILLVCMTWDTSTSERVPQRIREMLGNSAVTGEWEPCM